MKEIRMKGMKGMVGMIWDGVKGMKGFCYMTKMMLKKQRTNPSNLIPRNKEQHPLTEQHFLRFHLRKKQSLIDRRPHSTDLLGGDPDGSSSPQNRDAQGRVSERCHGCMSSIASSTLSSSLTVALKHTVTPISSHTLLYLVPPTVIYQSSSPPPFFPCILACLALNASARPPARLLPPPFPSVEFGVSLPLPPLPPPLLPMLTALSLICCPGGGKGVLLTPAAADAPVMGRFCGGAGGLGLDFCVPFGPLAKLLWDGLCGGKDGGGAGCEGSGTR